MGILVKPTPNDGLSGWRGRERGALDTGECVPVDGVVISAGSRSNVEVARQAGLWFKPGYRWDDGMPLLIPVFLPRDIAEHGGLFMALAAVTGAGNVLASTWLASMPLASTRRRRGIGISCRAAFQQPESARDRTCSASGRSRRMRLPTASLR